MELPVELEEPLPLTAREVDGKRFHDAWRGYDQREVDDFLDRVVQALAAAERARTELTALLAEATGRATRAEEEAARLRAQATAGGEDLVAQQRRLRASVARLERFEADLRLRLAAFLDGQSRALDELARAPEAE